MRPRNKWRKITSRPAWITFGLLVFANVVQVLAFFTMEWIKFTGGGYPDNTGLWHDCKKMGPIFGGGANWLKEECGVVYHETMPVWFRMVQALATTSFIFMLISLIYLCLYIWWQYVQRNLSAILVVIILISFTAFMMFLAIVVHAAYHKELYVDNFPQAGYSYGLYILSFFIAIASLACAVFEFLALRSVAID